MFTLIPNNNQNSFGVGIFLKFLFFILLLWVVTGLMQDPTGLIIPKGISKYFIHVHNFLGSIFTHIAQFIKSFDNNYHAKLILESKIERLTSDVSKLDAENTYVRREFDKFRYESLNQKDDLKTTIAKMIFPVIFNHVIGSMIGSTPTPGFNDVDRDVLIEIKNGVRALNNVNRSSAISRPENATTIRAILDANPGGIDD
jgi:hypothetical protein